VRLPKQSRRRAESHGQGRYFDLPQALNFVKFCGLGSPAATARHRHGARPVSACLAAADRFRAPVSGSALAGNGATTAASGSRADPPAGLLCGTRHGHPSEAARLAQSRTATEPSSRHAAFLQALRTPQPSRGDFAAAPIGSWQDELTCDGINAGGVAQPRWLQ